MKKTKSEQINEIASMISHSSHFTTNEDIAKKIYNVGYRKIEKGNIITTKDKIAKLNKECIKNSYYDDDMDGMPFVSGKIGIIDIYNLLKEWENENR